MNRGRRSLLLALGGLSVSTFAFSETRTPLPGGGSVVVPRPYASKTDYPNYAGRVPDALVAYDNWDSTLSGHPDCDGMLAVARPERFESLDRFVQRSSAALSSRWRDASKIPGQRWDGREKHFPMERHEGPDGPERVQRLAVTRSGLFSPYEAPARLYAVAYKRRLLVAVWLYDKRGGVPRARRIAGRIAESYQP